MQFVGRHWIRGVLCLAVVAVGGPVFAGSPDTAAAALGKARKADKTVASEVDEIKGNVEKSGEIMKKTYDKDREKGEGRVEAAGDAYEAVLEEGREKADGKR